tara:strand:- start:7629 stop:8966 length:1338 start_codon:yes stop_codon:yes gene_type:complete
MTKNKLSLVGLGKLGLPLASVFANNGYPTLGIDINEDLIKLVNDGKAPFHEEGLSQILEKIGGKELECTSDFSRPINETDITYILTNTPSQPDGSFSNKHILSVLESLSFELKKSSKEYHLFVISSTVMPGSISNHFVPLIEKITGRKLNEGFGVGYCPDFVAIGEVLKGFTNPELVVIGQSDSIVGELINEIHHNITENKPSMHRMTIASAEIAKVSLNAYITMKITFANTLANICSKTPLSNVDHITNAIGQDKRISPYYFKGGMSYGGTCFPRDTFAFNHLNKSLGLSTDLFDSIDSINRFQDQSLFERVLAEISDDNTRKVGILGMAFKPSTPVIEQSVGVKLLDMLLTSELALDISISDFYATDNIKSIYGDKINYSSSHMDCLNNSDIVIFINNENNFVNDLKSFRPDRKITIIDCWRSLDEIILDDNLRIIRWGSFTN